MPKDPIRIWITIENKEIIDFINQPAMKPKMLVHFCKFNPQLISEAVQAITTFNAHEQNLSVVPIMAFEIMVKDENTLEALLLMDGEPRDIERFINLMKARRLQQEVPGLEPSAYDAMKKSAFNLMRKNKIRDFSAEELHRVFKHAKEQLIYTSIVKAAIEDGLTITSLYEQDRDLGLER